MKTEKNNKFLGNISAMATWFSLNLRSFSDGIEQN